MIRHATGEGVAVFQHVETVHVRTWLVLGALLGEVLDGLTGNGVESEEVAVEGDDAESLAPADEGLGGGTEDFVVGGLLAGAVDGFVAEELRLWQSGLHLAQQTLQSRCVALADDDGQGGAAVFLDLSGDAFEALVGLSPGGGGATDEGELGALRIVEIQHAGLREGIQTTADGVERVAGEVRGAAFMRGDHQRRGAGGGGHGGGIKQRLPWDDPLDVVRVGKDVHDRATARGEAHHAGGGTHELQEITARVASLLLGQCVTGGKLHTECREEFRALLEFGRAAPVALAGLRLLGVNPFAFHERGKGRIKKGSKRANRPINGDRRCSFPAAEPASVS